jgi:hypothetical protein
MDTQRSIMQRALAGALSVSGDYIQLGAFLAMMNREATALGTTIAGSIQKVLNSLPVRRDEQLAPCLLAEFDAAFEPLAAQMRDGFGKNRQTLGHSAGADERFWSFVEDVRRDKKQEIRLMVEKMAKDNASRDSARINIEHSNVGFVQAGSGNVARIGSINISSADAAAVIGILHRIEERIGTLEEISEADKSELREIAGDAAAELSKERPNGFKLTALISALATTIKTIGGMKEIYDVLAPYLPALGVHL